MTDPARSPRILVADDDDEFREEIIPKALERIGAQIIRAKDVLEACLAVAEHVGPRRSLDVVVLDMHMPLHKGTKKIEDDAGIRFLRSYGLVTCPVVVFTAYPSYQNCVLATQAGAAAYLPKAIQDSFHGPEGGVDKLVDTCRRLLLEPQAEVTRVPPGKDWLQENHAWLAETFGGQWVAFVDAAKGRVAGLAGEQRGEVLIVSAPSKEELARLVIAKIALLNEIPKLAFVQQND